MRISSSILQFGTFSLLLLLNGCTEDISHNNIFIANFPYNKACAISFTFDDNCPSCESVIVPLFNEFGYKATFFIITDQIRDWKKWREFSNEGFEIGNHTASHFGLSHIYDSVVLNQQINASHDLISREIGIAPVSFAHPGHGTNATVDSVVFLKHLFTRITPRNFCRWDGWISRTSEERVKKEIESAIALNTWYVPAAHGVGDCWEPITKDFLFDILLFINKREQYIAVEPFKNIAMYKAEKASTQVVAHNEAGKKVIELKSRLADDLYDYPLTLVLKNFRLPDNFTVNSPNNKLLKILNQGSDLLFIVKPNAVIEIQWP